MTKFNVFYYDTVVGTVTCKDRVDAVKHMGRTYGGRVGMRIVEAAPAYNPDISVILEPDGFFRAIDNDNYDVDCDHTGFFTRSPAGYGRTPLDAIVDLLDNAAEG